MYSKTKNSRTKVTILSHLGGNIGHDLMACGVENIIKYILGDHIEIIRIEQHCPLDIYSKNLLLSFLNKFPHSMIPSKRFRTDTILPIRLLYLIRDVAIRPVRYWLNSPIMCQKLWPNIRADLKKAKFAIACGGPNIVHRSYESPEMALMLHHLHGAFTSNDVPVFNLSNGSAYPIENIPTSIKHPKDVAFYKRMMKLSTITTVRDRTAKGLFDNLGYDCQLIPCPALVAGEAYTALVKKGGEQVNSGHIIINFQEKGANDDWGQQVESLVWFNTMQTVISRIEKRHKIVFICHNKMEMEIAKNFKSSAKKILPKTLDEYAQILSVTSAGICNRLHAAIFMAGMGIMPIYVGTDTRMQTAEEIGIPCHFVKNVSADLLEAELENHLCNFQKNREKLVVNRMQTKEKYATIIKKFMK